MKNILQVKNLKTHFFTRRGIVKAVDGVSFSLKKGETLGIVGESGSGKSVTCLSILRLIAAPAGQIVDGRIVLDGTDVLSLSTREMRKVRGSQVSMILQDPMTSLNPVYTVGNQVAEPIRIHQKLDKKAVWEKAKEMLSLVKIPSPEVRMHEYPHQMSGGMRQRIVGAMTLSCRPKLLIADEPTTALDVTIQSQFINLLKSIQRESDLSMIMVTHDLGIVAKICDRVAVMYAGKIVENAPIRELFNNPKHPYTIALMDSLPKMEQNLKRLPTIQGQPPDLSSLPEGCSFAPRCPKAQEICLKSYPERSEVDDQHSLSCWLAA
ncbi:MAG: ABC transporter ATP-binding protein [Proteobacteria bacterium]|nr:ABC transporter ATP-binding protein [Pseudomonadota bacterium]